MRDALDFTKFANFQFLRCFRPAGCRKQFELPPHTRHHMRSACKSCVCMALGSWCVVYSECMVYGESTDSTCGFQELNVVTNAFNFSGHKVERCMLWSDTCPQRIINGLLNNGQGHKPCPKPGEVYIV